RGAEPGPGTVGGVIGRDERSSRGAGRMRAVVADVRVPDGIEPITAFRVWRGDLFLRLHSLNNETQWEPGRWASAHCPRSRQEPPHGVAGRTIRRARWRPDPDGEPRADHVPQVPAPPSPVPPVDPDRRPGQRPRPPTVDPATAAFPASLHWALAARRIAGPPLE